MLEIVSVLLIIFGLSLLVIIHEAGHFLVAKRLGLLVEEFGVGLPPRLWGKKIGETFYSINFLPFGGFVKIYGEQHSEERLGLNISRSFSRQLISKRAAVIVAGVVMNFLLGWFLISLVFIIGIPQALLVTEVKEGSLAFLAGIQKGDQVLGFQTVEEFRKFLDENTGKEVSLNIKRAGQGIFIKVTPRTAVPEGEGNLGVYLVESGLPRTGFFQSIGRGFLTAARTSFIIFLGIIDLIVGVFTDIGVLQRFLGPIGIVNVAIETTKLGVVHFIQLLSLISLNLAVFNVIPIPALDGGRLLFLLIEKLKGKSVAPQIEAAINGLGLVFLFFLIALITAKDLLALF